MNKKYIFLAVLMLVLAFGTVFFKETNRPKETPPEQLLWDIIRPNRYVTTDQVAKMIIQGDPSLEIIDVRNDDEYSRFSLPGAINIPLDSLLNRNNLLYFGVPGINVVFIANDDIASDKAWVLTKRLGFNGTYVMKGGLNRWMETIINPKEPSVEESSKAMATYEFRKGAMMYFTGAKAGSLETGSATVTIKRRKKTSAVAGGC
ncbi:MAG TPA: rhodanese-like domain-containing protein [Bacteroidales bacterium]|nr:rhodanese-like domain-containing protein [Bacteroidales bacterium]